MSGFLGIIAASAILTTGLGQETMATYTQTTPDSIAPGRQATPGQLEDIEVVGQSPDSVRALVRDLTMTNGAAGQLGRFDRYVCPGVVNMRPEHSRIIVDRIAGAATDLGLSVGPPGCSPNIIVVATTDAQTELPGIIRRMPAIFVRHARNVNDGRQALAAFINDERPVRWWHVVNDRPAGSEEEIEGYIGSRKTPSLLNVSTKAQIDAAVVVVDFAKIESVSLTALGDYVAMVSLARMNAEANVADIDSILALFSGRPDTPQEMTRLDRDYLLALYNMREDIPRWRQEAEIASRMMDPDSRSQAASDR